MSAIDLCICWDYASITEEQLLEFMVVVSAADHVKNKFAVLRCTSRGGGGLESWVCMDVPQVIQVECLCDERPRLDGVGRYLDLILVHVVGAQSRM